MMNRIHLHFPFLALRSEVQRPLLLVCLLCSLSHAEAQEEREDSTALGEERRCHQNVLLNATSSTQPRFISLGMPHRGNFILEDGLPCSSFSQFFPSFLSWHSGLGTENLQVTTLDESALQMGEIGYFASSTSKVGAERLEAAVDYTLGQYGRNVIDVLVGTPLRNGWSLNLNALQDMERGSNHLDASHFQQHIKSYKAGIQKKFGNGLGMFKGVYQYMDSYLFNDPYAPFFYDGDGGVIRYGDFNMAKDQYLPPVSTFDYVDVKSGERRTGKSLKDCSAPVHTATLSLDYLLPYDIYLEARTRLKVGENNLAEPSLSSIQAVSSYDGFFSTDGTPYLGNMQMRYLTCHDGKYLDNLTTLALRKQFGEHTAKLGANLWFTKASDFASTSHFAHEVKADPLSISYLGNPYFAYNLGALYFEGRQSRLALYGQDQWNILPRVSVRAGVRLEYTGIRGNAANNEVGKTNNTRLSDWNLAMLNVTKTAMDNNALNGALSLAGTYRLNDDISFEANAIATQQHAEMWQYSNAVAPSKTPLRTYLLRAGVNYKNDWLDLQSLLTYTRKSSIYDNSHWRYASTCFSHPGGALPVDGNVSTIAPILYGMHGFGWTTDLVAKPFGGFGIHALLTVRAPHYRNCSIQSFDGHPQSFDVSGKSVVSIPAVEFELEPSYEWEKWRIWLSARFYGKQYVNVTNSLYFNSHWETFAGVDFTANSHLAFSLQAVNLLNLKAMTAGMQEGFFATDASAYNHYLTSGTFIRPFTLEFKTSLRL